MEQQTDEFEPVWAAGFMSGTSIDAVDGALILTDGEQIFEFGPVAERKYTAEERRVLQKATDAARAWNWAGARPETEFSAARSVVTRTHGEAWDSLISEAMYRPAIAGVHGQTVLHRPPMRGRTGDTLQLINAEAVRARLGVPLAYDFRSADVASGGQGAPLAPAYHAALLRMGGAGRSAAVLNLGGVANITCMRPDGELLAFDTGPANGPIDEWVESHDAGTHDAGGTFAASGTVHEDLVNQWVSHPWFAISPPKSLDRFDFNAGLASGLSLEDGAATLTAFSAQAVAEAVKRLESPPQRLIVCGGGRHNPIMMAELQRRIPCPVETAEQAGWLGDSIEAQAFAYLAVRTLRGLPISWPGTTGVAHPMTGGKLLP